MPDASKDVEARARARNSQGWSGWSGTATFAKGDIDTTVPATRGFTRLTLGTSPQAFPAEADYAIIVLYTQDGRARASTTVTFWDSDSTVVGTVSASFTGSIAQVNTSALRGLADAVRVSGRANNVRGFCHPVGPTI